MIVLQKVMNLKIVCLYNIRRLKVLVYKLLQKPVVRMGMTTQEELTSFVSSPVVEACRQDGYDNFRNPSMFCNQYVVEACRQDGYDNFTLPMKLAAALEVVEACRQDGYDNAMLRLHDHSRERLQKPVVRMGMTTLR